MSGDPSAAVAVDTPRDCRAAPTLYTPPRGGTNPGRPSPRGPGGVYHTRRRLRRRVMAVASQPERPAVVLYDGQCPLCRRSVALLRRLDWLGRLAYADARDPAGL